MRISLLDMPDVKMTFTEHLAELRVRIIRSLIAVGVLGALAFVFTNAIFQFLRAPLGPEVTLQALTIMEGFMTKLHIAFYVGVFLALPVIIYQVLMFVMPALKPHERRVTLTGLLASGALTIAGLTIAYRVVLPMAFPVLRSLVPQGVEVNLRYETYVDVVFKFLIAFAAGFQFPIVMVSLVHLGVVPVRFFFKNTKYVLVIILIVSAVLTPGPDAISQLMMAIPLTCLYVLSMGVAYLVRKREV